jgi:ribonuclease HI
MTGDSAEAVRLLTAATRIQRAAPGTDPLDLLDEPLRERAVALRRLLRKPGRTGRIEIAELVSDAADAAFAGDQSAAAACLDRAEQFAGPLAAEAALALEAHDAAAAAAQEQQDAARAAWLASRDAARARGKASTVIKAGIAGQVRTPPATGPVVVATDGSYRAPHYGWAYITSGGQWGCAASVFGSTAAPDGHQASLYAELRAAGLAAAHVDGPAVFLTDSIAAIGLLRSWQAGDVTRMPVPQDASRASTETLRLAAKRRAALTGIAATIAGRPALQFAHVYGHRGHLLNEAADMLAKMAHRWLTAGPSVTQATMTAKADDLAAAFLRAWHATGSAAG